MNDDITTIRERIDALFATADSADPVRFAMTALPLLADASEALRELADLRAYRQRYVCSWCGDDHDPGDFPSTACCSCDPVPASALPSLLRDARREVAEAEEEMHAACATADEQGEMAEKAERRLREATAENERRKRALDFLNNQILFGDIVAEYAAKIQAECAALAAVEGTAADDAMTQSLCHDAADLREEDLRIETYRARGITNQTVTEPVNPAVRIEHIPTGIMVACQEHPSLLANKEQALRELAAQVEGTAATLGEETWRVPSIPCRAYEAGCRCVMCKEFEKQRRRAHYRAVSAGPREPS